MYTQNSASRPGNRSRANAYAASTENVSWPSRITAVINAVTDQRAAEPGAGRDRRSWPASAAAAATAACPVANWCAEVNDVSKPSANGANVITAPSARPG